MHKTLFLIVMSFLVCGCSMVPKTSGELVATSTTVQGYCYPDSRELVHERVSAFLERCYDVWVTRIPAGGKLRPMETTFQVVEETIPDGKRLSVRNTFGFGYSADITGKSEQCESEIIMFGVTGLWKRTFGKVDESARGAEVAC